MTANSRKLLPLLLAACLVTGCQQRRIWPPETAADSLREGVQLRQKAQQFFEEDLFAEAIAELEQAYQCDSAARDTAEMIAALRLTAQCYQGLLPEDHLEEAVTLMHEARELAAKYSDPRPFHEIDTLMNGWTRPHLINGELTYIVFPTFFRPLNQLPHGSRYRELYDRAWSFRGHNQWDSAQVYMDRLTKTDDSYVRMLAAELRFWQAARLGGDPDQTIRLVREYKRCVDEVMRDNKVRSIARADAQYKVHQKEQENVELRARMRLTVTLLVAVMLLLAVGLVAYWLYARQHRQVLRQKYERLKMLQEQPRPVRQDNVVASPAYERIRQCLAAGSPLTAADWAGVEKAVHEGFPDFARRLHSFVRLKEQEWHVCLLLKAGVLPTDIATLTAHSPQSVASTRSRLYEKTFGRKGKARDWDDFIASL